VTRRLPGRPAIAVIACLSAIYKESGSGGDEAASRAAYVLRLALPAGVRAVTGITMTVATKILVAKSGPLASNWNN